MDSELQSKSLDQWMKENHQALSEMVATPGWKLFQQVIDEAFVSVMELMLTLKPIGPEFPAVFANLQGKVELIKQLYDFESQVFTFSLDEESAEEKSKTYEGKFIAKLRNMFFRVIS